MDTNSLIYAFALDGRGGARKLTWQEIERAAGTDRPVWLHLDYTNPRAADWISNHSGLDEVSASALLTGESRPRMTLLDGGILLSLRGVNLNPGSDPEDMVGIRLWVGADRIISTRRRKLLSAADIARSLEESCGPKTTGEFIVDLCDRLIARMEETVGGIEDRLDELEEQIIGSRSHTLRTKLSEIRREAIMLKRYLAPQREAMARLLSEKVPFLSEKDRLQLRETTDRLIRYIEDLDSVRDRAAVTQEELVNRLSEQMNMRMYVLSLVAAVFLPLGFLTGLFGINVAGIPGSENPSAFLIFLLIMAVIVAIQVLILKKNRWF